MVNDFSKHNNMIHKYEWINKERGGLKPGMDAYYITPARYRNNAEEYFSYFFGQIFPADTIHIYRNNKKLKDICIFRMKNLQEIPRFYPSEGEN